MLAVPTNCTVGQIRLRGHHPREGRVEICLSGIWGTICHNSWDSREATVVCRQLGYPVLGERSKENIQGILSASINFHFTGAIPFTSSYFGRGTGAILIDYVSCTGNEQFLANCTNNGIGVTSTWCSHYSDVGVRCPGNIN